MNDVYVILDADIFADWIIFIIWVLGKHSRLVQLELLWRIFKRSFKNWVPKTTLLFIILLFAQLITRFDIIRSLWFSWILCLATLALYLFGEDFLILIRFFQCIIFLFDHFILYSYWKHKLIILIQILNLLIVIKFIEALKISWSKTTLAPFQNFVCNWRI